MQQLITWASASCASKEMTFWPCCNVLESEDSNWLIIWSNSFWKHENEKWILLRNKKKSSVIYIHIRNSPTNVAIILEPWNKSENTFKDNLNKECWRNLGGKFIIRLCYADLNYLTVVLYNNCHLYTLLWYIPQLSLCIFRKIKAEQQHWETDTDTITDI